MLDHSAQTPTAPLPPPGGYEARRFRDGLLLPLIARSRPAPALVPALAPEPAPARSGLAPWQLRKAQAMIEERAETGVCVEEIARACRLSRSYFSRAFKRSTGVPPHGWLVALRVAKAQRLLREREARIADVALECGFADQSHMTRSFAARLGTTPAAWRRAQAEAHPA